MVLDAIGNNVLLTDVERRQVFITLPVANQDVDTGSGELGTGLADSLPLLTWKHHADTGSIHPVNQAHTLGITVGDEDTDGKRLGAHRQSSSQRASSSAKARSARPA